MRSFSMATLKRGVSVPALPISEVRPPIYARTRTGDDFGFRSPRWTISSSRQPKTTRQMTPGPGAYRSGRDILENTPAIKMKFKKDVDYRTVTSNHEGSCIREFPTIREKHIGKRGEIVIARNSDAPPLYYIHPSTLTNKRVTIGKKRNEKYDDLPGPGAYSPRFEETAKLTTIPKVRKRDLFNHARSSSPSPGQYEISRDMYFKEPWRGSFRPLPVFKYDDE